MLLRTCSAIDFQDYVVDIDACISICAYKPEAHHINILPSVIKAMKPGAYFLCVSQPRSDVEWAWQLENQGLQIKDQITIIKQPQAWTIIMAMKAYEQNYANNAIVYGVAGLNIDKMRIGDQVVGWNGLGQTGQTWNKNTCGFRKQQAARPVQGRFPGNLILDTTALMFLEKEGIVPCGSKNYFSVLPCNAYNLYCYCLDLIAQPESIILNPFCDDQDFIEACANKQQQAIIISNV